MDRIIDPISDHWGNVGRFWGEEVTKSRAKWRPWSEDQEPIKRGDSIFSTRVSHFRSSVRGPKTGKIDRTSNSSPTARSHASTPSAKPNDSPHPKADPSTTSSASTSNSTSTSTPDKPPRSSRWIRIRLQFRQCGSL